MHQLVSATVDSSRRWWVLAIVIAAQFMFGVDAFIVNVALFMQRGLHIPLLQAGLVFVPLALAFVIASRHSAARARRRGTLVLIEGCAIQVTGLAAVALMVATLKAPTAALLALALLFFGYGQGLVMAPLSGAVLSTVKPASAGSGSGMYGTIQQIANAAGVAAIGATFFAIETTSSAQLALYASLALFALSLLLSVAFLSWMRRAVIK
jgi:MFS family permease